MLGQYWDNESKCGIVVSAEMEIVKGDSLDSVLCNWLDGGVLDCDSNAEREESMKKKKRSLIQDMID
jgi:hypothetical protein